LAAAAERGAHVAPEKGTWTKAASRKKGAPKAQKGAKTAEKEARADAKWASAKEAKPASTKASKPKQVSEAREGSRTATVLELLRRAKGAALEEIMKASRRKRKGSTLRLPNSGECCGAAHVARENLGWSRRL
jgi:hypothetical protein